jgi:hypothetical protein
VVRTQTSARKGPTKIRKTHSARTDQCDIPADLTTPGGRLAHWTHTIPCTVNGLFDALSTERGNSRFERILPTQNELKTGARPLTDRSCGYMAVNVGRALCPNCHQQAQSGNAREKHQNTVTVTTTHHIGHRISRWSSSITAVLD